MDNLNDIVQSINECQRYDNVELIVKNADDYAREQSPGSFVYDEYPCNLIRRIALYALKNEESIERAYLYC